MNDATESHDVDDWDDLVDSIKEEKCILFLGPESVMKSPGISYHQELIKSPDFQDNKYFKYLQRDEMFLLTQNFYRGKLVSRFKAYCTENAFFDETYKKIAAIPFHTIIVVTRYPFLVDTFKTSNIEFQHRWFLKTFNKPKAEDDKNQETQAEEDITAPSAKMPLVYNLFGKLDIDESLLLTHNDLFEYISKLLNENAIPTKLRELVKSSTEIIFLGFKFERWYVQLLLRLFELHDLNAKFERIAVTSGDAEDVLNVCETDFKINFIGENIDSFVNTLYDKCIENKLELRKPAVIKNDDPAGNEFKTLLENNRFDDALNKLRQFEAENNLEDSITQLAGIWNSIKEQQKDGTISPADLELEKNNLRKKMQIAMQDDMDKIKQN